MVFYYSGFCKQKTKNFKKVFMLNLQKRIYTTTEEIYDDILKIY
ncbi:hypothetical protein BSPLISOX_1475 [uncultured Gammaproteobacteria bacterium]|nr:hypothetical protein BSPLISOX_1475 [uncultured Gammaproteobacteria bacterium]